MINQDTARLLTVMRYSLQRERDDVNVNLGVNLTILGGRRGSLWQGWAKKVSGVMIGSKPLGKNTLMRYTIPCDRFYRIRISQVTNAFQRGGWVQRRVDREVIYSCEGSLRDEERGWENSLYRFQSCLKNGIVLLEIACSETSSQCFTCERVVGWVCGVSTCTSPKV